MLVMCSEGLKNYNCLSGISPHLKWVSVVACDSDMILKDERVNESKGREIQGFDREVDASAGVSSKYALETIMLMMSLPKLATSMPVFIRYSKVIRLPYLTLLITSLRLRPLNTEKFAMTFSRIGRSYDTSMLAMF
jgi:hypothetical protein